MLHAKTSDQPHPCIKKRWHHLLYCLLLFHAIKNGGCFPGTSATLKPFEEIDIDGDNCISRWEYDAHRFASAHKANGSGHPATRPRQATRSLHEDVSAGDSSYRDADTLPPSCACTGNNAGTTEEFCADYGAYCAPWDSVAAYCLPGGEYFRQEWCELSWCYVSPECPHANHSSFFESSDLHYSYTSCPAPPPPPLPMPPLPPAWSRVFDDDTTCTTDDRYYGAEAQTEINDGPIPCYDFCIEKYPDVAYTDYWPNAEDGRGWCNCYRTCPDLRCVSQECFGVDNNVDTFLHPLTSPTLPILPPSASPTDHLRYPAPPLSPEGSEDYCGDMGGARDNGTVVTISHPTPEYAAAHLQAALADPAVTVVCLYSNVSSAFGAFPTVSRPLQIFGRCAPATGAAPDNGGLCEVTTSKRDRIFATGAGGELRLQSVALRFGFVEADGGAVYVAPESRAFLVNCTLEANHADSRGGAVYVAPSAHLRIAGGVLVGNSALRGGAVFVDKTGGLVATAGARLVRNHAGANGGAIAAHDDSDVVMLGGTDVSGNYAESHGGGVYLFNAVMRLAQGSGLHGNFAEVRGGGLNCDQACQISMEEGVTIADNGSGEIGGGIYIFGTNMSMAGTSVERNTAGRNNGNALSGGGVYMYEYCKVRMTAGLVRGNLAPGDGGGIFVYNRSELALQAGCQVEENYAGENGGGVCGSGNTSIALYEASAVQGNVAGAHGGGIYSVGYAGTITTLSVENRSVVKKNVAGGHGGGVFSTGAFARVSTRSSVSGNIAGNSSENGAGGGLLASGGMVVVDGGSHVARNFAIRGGGIAIVNNATLTLSAHSVVEENICSGKQGMRANGGGLYAESGGIQILQSVVQGNIARLGCGGGMCMLQSVLALENGSTVRNNSANEGGGICQQGGHLEMRDSRVAGNTVITVGGGLAISEGCASNLFNSSLEMNNAGGDGGGMHVAAHSDATLDGCNVSSNAAEMSGGGLAVDQARMLLTGASLVEGNVADFYGGGIHTSFKAHVELDGQVVVADNSATRGGGAMVADLNCSLKIHGGGRLMRNFARYMGGGIFVAQYSVLHIGAGSVLEANRAVSVGGHLFVQNSRLELEGSRLLAGSSSVTGGAIHLEEQSVGQIRNSEIGDCFAYAGGGGCAVLNSNLLAQDTLLLGNHVGDTRSPDDADALAAGGGLLFADQANISVVRCRLVSNSATGAGGGMWADAGTVAAVRHTAFMSSAAVDGAAIALTSTVASIALDGVSFVGGRAVQGGAMHFTPPPQGSLALHELSFSSNQAEVGENIHWHVLSNFSASSEPLCIECTYPNGTELFSTDAVTYHVLQEEVAVGPAPAGGLRSASGETVAPPVTFVAVDYYGAITHLPVSLGVTVTSSASAVSGQSFAAYVDDVGAEFTSLAVQGDPGGTVQLTFAPQTHEWEPVVVTLVLDECSPGEVYDAAAKLCRACGEGFLKFDNTSAACEECVNGLTCSGANNFEVEAGYWLAPNTEQCGEDMECFMKRFYPCDEERACREGGMNASGQRSGNSSASAGHLQLCNKAYAGGVLCGGSAVPVCSDGYQLNAHMECSRCPSGARALIRMVLVVVIVFLVLAAIWGIAVLTRSISTDSFDMQDHLFNLTQHLMHMRGVTRLMVGYMQVMSQMQHIFQPRMPPLMGSLLSWTGFVDLNVFKWVGMKCLLYRFGHEDSPNFYYTYYQALGKPGLVLLFGTGVLAALQLTKKKKAKTVWAELLDDVRGSQIVDPSRRSILHNTDKRSSSYVENKEAAVSSLQHIVLSSTLFLVMFIHPSVSTTIFQLLNCFHIHNDQTHDSCGPEGCAYLHMDSSVQCYTIQWWLAFTCGVVVTAGYVIGFPVGLASIMFYHRRFAAVELAVPRDAACLADIRMLAHTKRWIPVDEDDLAAAETAHNDLLSLSCGKTTSAERRLARLDANVGRTAVDSCALFLQMYLQEGTFTEHANAVEERSATLSVCHTDIAGIDLGLMYAHEDAARQHPPAGVGLHGAPDIQVTLPSGTVITGVVLQKDSHVSDDSTILVKRTRLDDPATAVILDQFHNNFQDRYFYWECVEITRQLWQTGMVLVVEILLDENIALLFALLVAFIFAQFKLNPYVSDAHNRLYSAVLYNQFLLQLALMFAKLDTNYREMLDGILVIVQVMLFIFVIKVIWEDVTGLYRIGAVVWKTRGSLSNTG
ncbi:hypothetical protein CYMTET_45811 [Cymbomonas tetramitiformis]|uniref:Pectate lyase C n=1 Tax=Cymbomonas tetramitiformis TaxID=36881 RepID=A0AAE0EXY4_9CHLO|nr:hypothetical protein CYMTET_45811 [Cymbomonas tetramitiformis]